MADISEPEIYGDISGEERSNVSFLHNISKPKSKPKPTVEPPRVTYSRVSVHISDSDEERNEEPQRNNDDDELSSIAAHIYESIPDTDKEGYEIPIRRNGNDQPDIVIGQRSHVSTHNDNADDGHNYESYCRNRSMPRNRTSGDDKVPLPIVQPSRSKTTSPCWIIICLVVGMVFFALLFSVVSAYVVYHIVTTRIDAMDRDRQNQTIYDLRKEDTIKEDINAAQNELVKSQDDLNALKGRVTILNNALIELIQNTSSDMNERLEILSKVVQKTQNTLEADVKNAFSATSPAGLHFGRLTFSHTIYNHGGDFSENTGKLTCSKPGVYYFSVSLTESSSGEYSTSTVCSLYKNSDAVLVLQVGSCNCGTDIRTATTTNSALLHLNIRDTVSLQDCSNATAMESWSSFTGFLVYPDQ